MKTSQATIALCPGEQYINFIVLQISNFHCGEIEVFDPPKFYQVLVDTFLPTFRDSLLIPYSEVKRTKLSGVKSQ
jgi:hypothetical protein